jgi:hypothetical protein
LEWLTALANNCSVATVFVVAVSVVVTVECCHRDNLSMQLVTDVTEGLFQQAVVEIASDISGENCYLDRYIG